jgi:hypothetical protein
MDSKIDRRLNSGCGKFSENEDIIPKSYIKPVMKVEFDKIKDTEFSITEKKLSLFYCVFHVLLGFKNMKKNINGITDFGDSNVVFYRTDINRWTHFMIWELKILSFNYRLNSQNVFKTKCFKNKYLAYIDLYIFFVKSFFYYVSLFRKNKIPSVQIVKNEMDL